MIVLRYRSLFLLLINVVTEVENGRSSTIGKHRPYPSVRIVETPFFNAITVYSLSSRLRDTGVYIAVRFALRMLEGYQDAADYVSQNVTRCQGDEKLLG